MTDDGYTGPATLAVAESGLTVRVRVRLSGRVEPVDGRYHWAGRIAAQDAVTALVRAGVRSVTLRIGDAAPVAVRLGDVDPWGAVRAQATSPPPWPHGTSDDAAAERDVDSRSLGAVTG